MYKDEAVSAFDVNWQNSASYNYTGDLVRADWAWEALRRNAQFRKSRLEAQPALSTTLARDTTLLSDN